MEMVRKPIGKNQEPTGKNDALIGLDTVLKIWNQSHRVDNCQIGLDLVHYNWY